MSRVVDDIALADLERVVGLVGERFGNSPGEGAARSRGCDAISIVSGRSEDNNIQVSVATVLKSVDWPWRRMKVVGVLSAGE